MPDPVPATNNKREFLDKKRPGYKLTVSPGHQFITLCIDSPFRAMCFYLNPDDTGDLAAAVWECSPGVQRTGAGSTGAGSTGMQSTEVPIDPTGSKD